MRLLHTADWHIGRTIEGRDRTREHEEFFDELYHIAEDEKVDCILIAGDVFDSVNPPAKGEELFYETIHRLSNGGNRPIVVIAGNHDHPDRLGAARSLTEKHNITIISYPTITPLKIQVPNTNEVLNIAALAYPSESRLKVSFIETGDEHALREAYDERIARIFQRMTENFSETEVNIAMSHIFVAGGSSTDSERPIEVGGAYTVKATSLPKKVQYTALGHLHRPQDVKRSVKPARYSGSPLAFSFSEAGYAKSVTIVDVKPREEAKTKEIILSSGKPLVRWKATEGLAQVYRWMDEGKDKNAWIDLEVHVKEAPSLESIHHMKKTYPGLLTIRPIFPEDEESVEVKEKNIPIDELFKRFYAQQTGGGIPSDDLVSLFLELINEEEQEV